MLRAGIVGLPNVGKSTLFNAITRTRKAESANYPFCTIDPNVGVVTVPDNRLEPLAKIAKTEVIHPTLTLASNRFQVALALPPQPGLSAHATSSGQFGFPPVGQEYILVARQSYRS